MALPSKPKFSDFKKVTTIQGTHEVVGLNPSEPNAGDRNARFQLSDLRSFLMTGVPTSPGKWVSQPSVTVTPNGDGTASIAVTAGTATFNGVTVEYNAITYPSVSLPGQGLMRQDAVSALENGTFSYVTGTASQNPATPSLPSGSLLANYILLDSTGGQIEEPVAYEPAFTKNTAFNKNFGTAAGTVAEGNHTHTGYASSTHNHAGEAITSGTVADARLSSNVALKAINNLFSVIQTFSAGILSNSIANITSANNALLSLLATGVEAVTSVSSNVALKIRNTVTSATGNLTEWITGTTTVAKMSATGVLDITGITKAGNVAFVDNITNIAPTVLQGVGDIPPTEIAKLQDTANWTSGEYTGSPLVNCNQGTGISLTINSIKYRVVFDTDNVPTRLTRG
jgi:hypothetical protein